MGDTQMIEDMFKHMRGAVTKQQDPKVLDVFGVVLEGSHEPNTSHTA